MLRMARRFCVPVISSEGARPRDCRLMKRSIRIFLALRTKAILRNGYPGFEGFEKVPNLSLCKRKKMFFLHQDRQHRKDRQA